MSAGEEFLEIADEDDLFRRLIPTSVKQGVVLASAYYGRGMVPDPAISVNIARLSSPAATLVGGRLGSGVGVLKALVPRAIGLEVVHAPDRERGNDAHALIVGATEKQHCRILAQQTSVVLEPGTPERH